MRTFLDRLYRLSGYLSGLCILLITLLILAQIVGRLLGFIVPSVEDFSGYCLAAATFFGLAYTLHEGGHIRVTLVIRRLSPGLRRWQEGAILLLAIALAIFMTWYAFYMVWESYVFEEVSYGYIPVPIWIPQLPVGLGLLLLTIALLDDFVCLIRHRQTSYLNHEDELNLEEI